jgi:hypothetical protein
MRRLVSMLWAACLAATLLVTAPASPASAEGACPASLGTLTTGAPLFFPGVALTPTFTTFSMSFTVGACVNVTTAPPGAAVAPNLTATGVLSGYCGTSSGSGITSNGYRFSWVSAGGVLVLTGELTGLVGITPDTPNGESCATGANAFITTAGPVLDHHCGMTVRQLQATSLLHYWTDVCVLWLL